MNVHIYQGDLQCCRVCLATDIKLISFDNPLKQTYFEFCGVPISATDGLPQHICVFCRALLKKSSYFRQKCKDTYTLLTSHLLKMHALTTSYIETLDKSNLRTPLHLMEILQCNCVPDNAICTSDKETGDFNDSENIDSLNIDSTILHGTTTEDEEEIIEDFKKKHFTQYMNSDKELFYYYILEKYVTKSRNQLNNFISKQNLDIDDAIDHRLIDDAKHPIIQAEVNNVIKICNDIHHRSQKRLFEYINNKYVDKIILPAKQKTPIDLDKVKEKRIKKRGRPTESLEKLSKEFNFDITVMLKEDIIKDVLKRKHSDNYKNAKYKCDLCFMGFRTENTLQNHNAIHDMGLPFECEFCHARFKNSRKQKKHLALSHRYKFVCRQCGQTNRSINYATRVNHIRIKHGSVSCDICHLKYATEAGLLTHKAKAHRELFKCPVCLVQFHNENALQRHTQVTAQNCGKHIRPCTRCGDSFNAEDSLKQHMLDYHPPERSRRVNAAPIQFRFGRRGDYTCQICFMDGFKIQVESTETYSRFHSTDITVMHMPQDFQG
ncbi:zinc-finger associated domain (zf-AD) domain-containing protein [Phthorimaea operculella]|nr:zinc-finger associated domain (zf-AD) domain-containing protein [Phthorimaea operculella]